MTVTARLALVKPDAGTNVVEGETATGQPNESFNLDAIDTAIAALQDTVPPLGAPYYAASGAITQKAGLVMILKVGVAAMTLADPVAGADDGKVLRILGLTPYAHTVMVPTVFLYGGLNRTTATFGGALGDMLCLIAVQGRWVLLPSINQTLS
jgi:hypothetical protein